MSRTGRAARAPRLILMAALAALTAVAAQALPAPRPATIGDANASAVGNSPSPMETGVLDEINAARADPHGYADSLRRYRTFYHGRQVDEPGHASIMTSEGVAAVDDAIAYLDRRSPMAPLQGSDGLFRATKRLAGDLASSRTISHVGADGSTMRDRLQAAGVWAGAMEEDISLSQRTAHDVVRQLVIDDGVPARGHRTALFDPVLKVAGAACGPHVSFGTVCVIDFAGVLMAPPGSEQGQQASAETEAQPASDATQRQPEDGAPPPGEQRLVSDEVVIEVANETTPGEIDALARRYGLATLESLKSELTGTTLLRARILDGRPVAEVVRAAQVDPKVISAQPNYIFTLQKGAASAHAIQYATAKLRLREAHKLATGRSVLIGVLDTSVDTTHPELSGAIAATFDALGGAPAKSTHGTAIAALIAGHGRLLGSAPEARILAARAFSGDGPIGYATTTSIRSGLDWLTAHGARVINMSFAGPRDPDLHKGLEGVYRHGVILIAAAGNAGPASPPLFPGADPDVIAVAATDPEDKIFAASNRGAYIQVAAPGVDLLIATPGGGYDFGSGTSFSAAEVTGIVALLLQENPRLTQAQVRAILLASAKTLGSGGPRDPLTPRLVDAYRAVAGQGR
ncbi:MAG: S8 family serine peptidase [Caulobacterales bacterium]